MWEKQKESLRIMKQRSKLGKGNCLFAEMGTGKALPLDAPILTPQGWVTMGDICVGDSVIGRDGKATKVVGVYPQGVQDIYRITFSDNTTADCTLDHLWEVTTPCRKWRKQESLVLSVAELLKRGLKHKNGNRKYYIPMVEPIEFPSKPITTDPYLLGLLLGDGYLRYASLSTQDSEILEAIRDDLYKKYGIIPKLRGKYDYDLTVCRGHSNRLIDELRALNLLGTHAEDKFIPDVYLYNNVKTRLAVLQGLLDTDGGLANSDRTSVEYSTCSLKLSEQVKFLVQSLGGRVTISERYPEYVHEGERCVGKLSYRLYLSFPNGIKPFRLSRKVLATRRKYEPTRAIESIEKVRSAEAQCIKIANSDGLFVINDCILTHNTRVAIHWIEWLFGQGKKLCYIVGPLTALHVWVENWDTWATYPVAFIDLHDAGPAGIREAQKLAKAGYPVICLVNYEAAWQIGMRRVQRKRHGEDVTVMEKTDTALSDIHWDIGILDESTTIKSPSSKVSKFFRAKMAPRTGHRLVMTGSAYTKRPLDVWAQVNFACGNEVFPSTFTAFRALYAIPHPTIRGAIVGYQNLDDFVRRLSKCAILLKKSDVLDLPPAVHETRLVDLCPKSRRIYNDLQNEMVAELEAIEVRSIEYRDLKVQYEAMDEEDAISGEAQAIAKRMEELESEGPVVITAEHVFSRIQKLTQVCSGFIYPDATEVDARGKPIRPEAIRLGHEKLYVLMEVLENRSGKPTVIVTQSDEEERIISEAVKKQLKFVPKILNGSVSGAETRHKMIAAAAADPCFIVKQSVGARGVDMRWADMIIFFSHNANTEFYEQMLCRNHRGGQTKSVTYLHLLARDTRDMKTMRILTGDLALARSIESSWRELLVA
jgi:hypothetical protein